MAQAKKYAYNGKLSEKKYKSLTGQFKIVIDDLIANREPRLISEITESCGSKIVTRQDVNRVVGYYVVIAKTKGFCDAFLNDENETEENESEVSFIE
jgi:hypothetical protein